MTLDPPALAALLLGSTRPSRADVWCHRRTHRLARIYELPGGARVMAVGSRQALNAELFDDVTPDDASTASFGPWVYDLDGHATGIFLRCRCGTYSADVARLAADIRAGHAELTAGRTFRRRSDVGSAL